VALLKIIDFSLLRDERDARHTESGGGEKYGKLKLIYSVECSSQRLAQQPNVCPK